MEQDESLPGWGKGGILQFAFAGKTSTAVVLIVPPVIIKPAQNMDERSAIFLGGLLHNN